MYKEWIRTDGTQFVHKINDTEYEVVEVVGNEEVGFQISHQEVDLKQIPVDHIQDIIEGYGYKNIEEIKKTYNMAANQIIAECYAETYWEILDDLDFNTEDEAIEYIEQEIIHCQIK